MGDARTAELTGAAEPTAEQEREVDPRWAALAQIEFSQPKEGS